MYAATNQWEEIPEFTSVYTLNPLDRIMVGCGFAMALPNGTEVQIRSKKGLAFNKGLLVLNGVGTVDAQSRGELCVLLINQSMIPISLYKGDKIASGVFGFYLSADFEEVEELPVMGQPNPNPSSPTY